MYAFSPSKYVKFEWLYFCPSIHKFLIQSCKLVIWSNLLFSTAEKYESLYSIISIKLKYKIHSKTARNVLFVHHRYVLLHADVINIQFCIFAFLGPHSSWLPYLKGHIEAIHIQRPPQFIVDKVHNVWSLSIGTISSPYSGLATTLPPHRRAAIKHQA